MNLPLIALAVALACGACSGSPSAERSPSPSPSPTPMLTASPGAVGTANPSPTGTTVPMPAEWADLETFPLSVLPTPPAPTVSPDPAVWRVEIRVVTRAGTPLEDVCMAIGRRGCLRFSPRSDERGVAVIDVPQVRGIDYELFFFKEGYTTGRVLLSASGPRIIGVVLEPR